MKKLAMLLTVVLVIGCLAVPAVATDFTPSVAEKAAPTVSTMQDSEGNSVVALIKDADGNEIAGVLDGSLTVTPYSASSSADADVSAALTAAYEQIASVDTLEDLATGLTAYYQEKIGDASASVSNLVVRDVFDVTVTGEYAEYLAVDGNTITIRFEVDLDPDAFLAVLHNYEGDEWELIADERVVRNADGSVDVTFDSLSPIAFVVDGSETDTASSVTSPETGESNWNAALLMMAAVLACGAVTLFATGKKKSTVR